MEIIILKGLEKDPARRFQTASEFAEGIRRHLRDEPISARPPSQLYQLRKFARRNRALVLGPVATFLALVVGVVGMTMEAARATRERDRAIRAEREAAATSRLWRDLLEDTDSWNVGTGAQVIESLLDRTAAGIVPFEMDPLEEATMHLAIGQAYRACWSNGEGFASSAPPNPGSTCMDIVDWT